MLISCSRECFLLHFDRKSFSLKAKRLNTKLVDHSNKTLDASLCFVSILHKTVIKVRCLCVSYFHVIKDPAPDFPECSGYYCRRSACTDDKISRQQILYMFYIILTYRISSNKRWWSIKSRVSDNGRGA